MKRISSSAVLLLLSFNLHAESASKRVEESEKHIQGKSFVATGTMTVVRGKEDRKMKMKLWWKDRKFALIRILEPKKDEGTGNLRIKSDLWQYLPKVNRIIRVPSSMMLQSWMGSDFSNDDLVKGGSLLTDYTHKELGKEKILGQDTVKIECTPKPDAPVVWGKVILWVRASDNAFIKQEFYTEKGDLIKVLSGDNIQKFGSHTIPIKLSMKNMKKDNSETIIEYEKDTIEFDKDIPESFFTQENLRKPL